MTFGAFETTYRAADERYERLGYRRAAEERDRTEDDHHDRHEDTGERPPPAAGTGRSARQPAPDQPAAGPDRALVGRELVGQPGEPVVDGWARIPGGLLEHTIDVRARGAASDRGAAASCGQPG